MATISFMKEGNSNMNLQILIQKARARDADAFTELMRLQMQNMYKAAYSYLSCEEDVADAISETILTCWEKMDQLRNETFFRTWMTRILINKCKDILKKKERIDAINEMPEVAFQEQGFQNMEWKEALASLGEKYRIVIILYYVEEFSTVEIAEILDMRESTVRTRLARGRKMIAKEYYPEIQRRNLV